MADFWAITTYFNPIGYERRLANYRTFRSRLGVPLITVEWSWSHGSAFQLTKSDAEILIQIRGDDLMWQKERLLNLALAALPAECRYVAWLDCDIVFDDANWPLAAAQRLRDVPMLHLCDAVWDLGPEQTPPLGSETPVRIKRSLLSESRKPSDILRLDFDSLGCTAGHAWAANTNLIKTHGFYDGLIIGGGDRGILYAALGSFDDLSAVLRMNPLWMRHYEAWARPFHDDVRGRVGHSPGRLVDLWHGRLDDRRYLERHRGFSEFDFRPDEDIAEDAGGGWRWASPKPQMHAFVRDYFAGRKEDG